MESNFDCRDKSIVWSKIFPSSKRIFDHVWLRISLHKFLNVILVFSLLDSIWLYLKCSIFSKVKRHAKRFHSTVLAYSLSHDCTRSYNLSVLTRLLNIRSVTWCCTAIRNKIAQFHNVAQETMSQISERINQSRTN